MSRVGRELLEGELRVVEVLDVAAVVLAIAAVSVATYAVAWLVAELGAGAAVTVGASSCAGAGFLWAVDRLSTWSRP